VASVTAGWVLHVLHGQVEDLEVAKAQEDAVKDVALMNTGSNNGLDVMMLVFRL
jgi:hypothetical protein